MTDEQLMLIAIEEAKLAESHGDIPIGALVVLEGDIISSRHNERELQNDPTAGALGSLYQLGSDPRLNHEFVVTPRVLQEECGRLLQKFFQSKRD